MLSCDVALRFLNEAGCTLDLPRDPSWDERWLIERVRNADALVVAMEPVTQRLIDSAKKLKIIARPGVGYDTVDLAAATQRGIVVTIAAGTNDQSVADYTMGLLLVAARGILAAYLSDQQPLGKRVIGTEVWKKTLMILGMGRVGKGVARRARGFDMRVLAVVRHPDHEFAAQHGVEYVSLEDGLRRADFVSLHVPLTAETENVINERSIKQMKRGAYLINTSRGALIDEFALAEAVSKGHLAGAAVDVLGQPGINSPLVAVPNIVVTPHMASLTQEAIERVAMSVARSIVSVLKGERPANVVNPQVFES